MQLVSRKMLSRFVPSSNPGQIMKAFHWPPDWSQLMGLQALREGNVKAFEDALEEHMWKFVQAVGMQLQLLLAECAPVSRPHLMCCAAAPLQECKTHLSVFCLQWWTIYWPTQQ